MLRNEEKKGGTYNGRRGDIRTSTVADSMEVLQKSMTLLMNSILMEREARKWEEEKQMREMEEKETKDKKPMEIENERYEARTKLEEARIEARTNSVEIFFALQKN